METTARLSRNPPTRPDGAAGFRRSPLSPAPDGFAGRSVRDRGDGNPNPIRWLVSAAVCGNSPLPGREGDTLGVGVYDLGLSPPAKDLVPGLRDEYGVELFDNRQIAPGCHLTPDLQVIHPGLAPVATAPLLGVRLKLNF